jgi:hypothetical protein
MSDQDRNETTGQFESSAAEGPFGLEGIEAESGVYKPMTEPPKANADEITLADAEIALELQAQEQADPTQIVYFDANGEKLNDEAAKGPVATVKLEAAAEDYSNYSANVADHSLANIDAEFARQVDAERLVATQGDQELAKEFGIEPPAPPKSEADKADEAAIDAVEGLQDSAKAFLKDPQIRDSIQREYDAADQVKQAYTAQLQHAQAASLAALVEAAPHLAGLPPAEIERGLNVLAQVDPPAFQRAMKALERTKGISQAIQQEQQHSAQVQRQQFEAYGRAEDARLAAETGKSPKEIREIGERVVEHLGKLGISERALAYEWENNSLLRSAAGQKVLMRLDELETKYAAIQNAAKPRPDRPLPPVQRPGIARSKAEIDTDDLRSMYRQLDSAKSESQQLKIAARIMGLK